MSVQDRVIESREGAYTDAIRALAKYKFWMFGYHAASWVKYNRLLKGSMYHQGSPFRVFVRLAVIERGELHNARPHEIHEGDKAALQHNAIYPSKSDLNMDLTENETASIVDASTPTHDTGENHETH
jgi:hypothetical protein